MKHFFAPTALVVSIIALTGCGGGNSSTATDTATATQAQSTETQTATQTTTTTSPAPVQREAVVAGKEETLQSGDIGMKLKVDKVVDPVLAQVDRAQPGNKLVGIFVTGQTKGIFEPTQTGTLTSLQTTDGKISGLRVIADGDCAGGFSADELLTAQKKPVTGCIGFEIPKTATPESITIALTSPKGTQQATWKLPKAQ